MARLTRSQLLYDGCYAHIISRSMQKRAIFMDTEDFVIFRELLLEAKQAAGFRIFHYCLMGTHFHLAVKIPDVVKFSRGLQKLKSQYVYKFHAKYSFSGPVWRERFRSLLIEDEAYLYACGQYIENNPVKADLVPNSDQWEYSSTRHYLGKTKDLLVDGYEEDLPLLPSQINLQDGRFFEDGIGIGSDFFRFKLTDKFKQIRPLAIVQTN